jgi:hypothetical protein
MGRFWLELPAVGWVVLGISYAVGGPLLGIGLYLVVQGSLPGWFRDWMLGPIARVTPGVVRLLGLTAIGLGVSIVALGLTMFVSEFVGGALVLVALSTYLLGAGLFVYNTWLSRRRPAS